MFLLVKLNDRKRRILRSHIKDIKLFSNGIEYLTVWEQLVKFNLAEKGDYLRAALQ